MTETEGAGGGGAAAGGAGRGRGVNDVLLAGIMGDVLSPPCWLSRRTAAAQAKGGPKTSPDEGRRPARRRGAGLQYCDGPRRTPETMS